MTVSELKDMINNTIVGNGQGEITGTALNLALNKIVDAIGDGDGGESSNSVTIFIPRDDSWDDDNVDSAFLENNKTCYNKLQSDNSVIIRLKYFDSDYPFEQSAIFTNLYNNYPVVLCSIKMEVFTASDDVSTKIINRYALSSDGTITKINSNGVEIISESALIGKYTVTYTKDNQYLTFDNGNPEIFKQDGVLMMKDPIGKGTEAPVEIIDNTLIVDCTNVTSSYVGPITNSVIRFKVSKSNSVITLTNVGTIETGATNFTKYIFTKI